MCRSASSSDRAEYQVGAAHAAIEQQGRPGFLGKVPRVGSVPHSILIDAPILTGSVSPHSAHPAPAEPAVPIQHNSSGDSAGAGLQLDVGYKSTFNEWDGAG